MKNLLLIVLFLNTISGFTQKTLKVTDTINLEEVVLTAVRAGKKAPFAQTILEKTEIEQRNLGQDLPVLMNFMPSVVTTTDAGAGVGYTGIRVRGSDATRVNITINGIPFNDSESQGTYWVDLPDFASSVQDLQLQRGVGTSTNGSGAFGASINIQTENISKRASAEISSSFGSYHTFKNNVKFSTGLLHDHFEIAGRLSVIKSDGYIDRASSDLKSYFIQAAYKDRNTVIKALTFGGKEITYQAWYGIDKKTLDTDRRFNPAGMYTDDEGNIRFYDNEVDNYQQDHYQFHWSQKYNNYWTTNLGLNYTKGKGYFEQYKEDQNFKDYDMKPITIGGEIIDQTDLIRRRWLDNGFYVANFTVNHQVNNLEMIFGAFYSFYDGDHFGEVIWAKYASDSEIRNRYYEGNTLKNEFNIFAKATYHLGDQWSLFADMQERFIRYKTNGLTSDRVPIDVNEKYNFFNPKFGVNFDLNHHNSFYISYARANREPNRNDFENNITKAETLNDIEAGWRLNTLKIKLNTNFYYMYYRNQLVLTGMIDDVGNPIRTTSGESYRAGIELDADFTVLENLHIRPNFTLSSNKNIDFVRSVDGKLVNLGKTNISFSPGIIASNIISYVPAKNLQINFLSKYVGEQYMGNIDSDTSKLDSYFVNDLNITYKLEDFSVFKSISFSGMINNLFNVKYVSNGYFYTYDDTWSVPGEITTIEGAGYYPQAEINFLLGVNLQF